MKRIFALLVAAFALMSCEEFQDFEDNRGHTLTFLEGEMKAIFSDKGDTKNYKFTSTLDWSTEVSADWVEVKPSSGKAGENKIQIKVDKNKSKEKRTGHVDIVLSNDQSFRIELEQLASGGNGGNDNQSAISTNEIWYTSIDGEIVEPNDPTAFNVSIVSNTYENGQGIIRFDGEVTEVGDMAFYGCNDCVSNCYNLTSFILPKSVTSIGAHAFDGCRNLQSVTISDNVDHIDNCAFICCTSLKEFNSKYASEDGRCLVIDGVLNSFAPSGLSEYTIPDNITEIGEQAFRICGLKSITIPASVTTIGVQAFRGCTSLASITIPASVTTLGFAAFYNSTNLKSVYCKPVTPPMAPTNNNGLWYGFIMDDGNGGLCNIDCTIYVYDECVDIYKSAAGWSEFADLIVDNGTIPEGTEVRTLRYTTTDNNIVEPQNMVVIDNRYENGEGVLTFYGDVIAGSAFANCTTLQSVIIPEGVTVIGDKAFWQCYNLNYAYIPNGVTTIGLGAFGACSLESVTIPESVTTMGEAAFIACVKLREFKGKYATDDGLALVDGDVFIGIAPAGITEYTVPDGIRRIGSGAFQQSNLYNIYLPNSVTVFGNNAFGRNQNLTELIIPEGVTLIEAYAIQHCTSLKSITIPHGVKVINNHVFIGCTALESVTIPDGVTAIGNYAFAKCPDLTEITIPDGVTTIGEGTFWQCSSLTNATLGEQVTTIGLGAFQECSSLTEITIPDSVTTIGVQAFALCSGLTEITIPNSVTEIGSWAFYDCTGELIVNSKIIETDFRTDNGSGSGDTYPASTWLQHSNFTKLTIGENITKIGNLAFFGCGSLTEITIPDSVTTIGKHAFYGCRNLTEITIPESVTTIGRGVFIGCSNLTAFYGKFASDDNSSLIVDGVLNAFAPSSGITEYTIPDSVTKVGWGAFYNCTNLTNVTIPESVTTVEAFAFSLCSNLLNVYCKATTPPAVTLQDGYWWAFGDTAYGWKIYVPVESMKAYRLAEGWSDYASDIVGYDFKTGEVVWPSSIAVPTPANNEIWYTNGSYTDPTIPYDVNAFGANIVSNTLNTDNENYYWVITFDGDVTSVGDYAFYKCSDLKSISIPDSATSIGESAFADCSSLRRIFIGENVQTLGLCAFMSCFKLRDVYSKPTTPPVAASWMFENNSELSVCVPYESIQAYKSAEYWDRYTSCMVASDFYQISYYDYYEWDYYE